MLDRRIFLTTVAGLLGTPLAADAQQAGKVYRVGHLMRLQREALAPFIARARGLRQPLDRRA